MGVGRAIEDVGVSVAEGGYHGGGGGHLILVVVGGYFGGVVLEYFGPILVLECAIDVIIVD